jgi:hypothetical protein
MANCDQHLRRALAVAVDAPVSLLEPVRVPGDLVVEHAVAVALEVDAFARRVRRKKDPNRRLRRIGLERGLDPAPLRSVHAAIEELHPLALRETAGGEEVEEGVLRVAVLGEDD